MQRYKIYINESPLILTQTSDLEDETVFERTLIHGMYRGKPKMLINYIELLEKNKHHEGIIIQADDVKQLWKDFRSLLLLHQGRRWPRDQSIWKSTPHFQKGSVGSPQRKTGSR
jgi:hypothetical protein